MTTTKARIFFAALMLLTFALSGTLLYAECEGDGCVEPVDTSAAEVDSGDAIPTEAPADAPPEEPAQDAPPAEDSGDAPVDSDDSDGGGATPANDQESSTGDDTPVDAEESSSEDATSNDEPEQNEQPHAPAEDVFAGDPQPARSSATANNSPLQQQASINPPVQYLDSCTNQSGNWVGGANDECTNGGSGNDTLWGSSGNDSLSGSGGNDYLYGCIG